jgi:hypothetical protein
MRRTATLALVFAAAAAVAAPGDDKDKKDKAAVREIPITEEMKITVVPPEKGGKATEPTVVAAADELPKFPPFGPPAVEALRKQVDFGTEKLVVFWWGGSGQDALAAGELTAGDAKAPGKGDDGKRTATFAYTPGRTRDFRGHLKLFVVPKDAEVKVETGKNR